MPPAVAALASRFYGIDGLRRSAVLRAALLAAPHLIALVIMLRTEDDLASRIAFVLAWGLFNSYFLAVLPRPSIAGVLSLAAFTVLILHSQLKHAALVMTVNFVDLMIIDKDTLGFLLTVMPGLWANVAVTC